MAQGMWYSHRVSNNSPLHCQRDLCWEILVHINAREKCVPRCFGFNIKLSSRGPRGARNPPDRNLPLPLIIKHRFLLSIHSTPKTKYQNLRICLTGPILITRVLLRCRRRITLTHRVNSNNLLPLAERIRKSNHDSRRKSPQGHLSL
jgi:hypothetical protein